LLASKHGWKGREFSEELEWNRYLVDASPGHNRGGEVLGDAAHRVSHLHTAVTARISGGGGAEHALFH
jgi:hypothetical protein